MKKVICFFVLSLILVVSNGAFGGEELRNPINLVGTWTGRVNMVSEAGYTTKEFPLHITDQEGCLFRGYAEYWPGETSCFNGTINNALVHMSAEDTIIFGRVNIEGTKMFLIIQNTWYEPPDWPYTARGIATKD